MTQYPFATIMLLLWPVITAVIFTRMERIQAVLWSLLAGYMFLPPSIALDLPAFPGLGKYEIASLSVALMLWLGMGRAATDPDPMAADPVPALPGGVRFLIMMMIVGAVLTVFSNGDPLVEGVTYRPGMAATDIITALMEMWMTLIPFFIGFRLLSTPRATAKLLRALMIAVLIYSLPMLFEVRMSPQLNTWIYGYFQHDFVQAIRYGGFRPIVFMIHPIWVASFATMGFIAALTLTRAFPTRLRMVLIVFYIAGVLLMCKTMTAILMAGMAAPIILFLPPRMILGLSLIVGLGVISYPLLRLFELVPTDEIVEFVTRSQPERAESLAFRFDNEVILLERAIQRPYFGWGSWGRNFPLDPVTGRTLAVVDGSWVLFIGARGLVGYLALFGLLLSPLVMLWRRRVALVRRYDETDSLMVAAIALMLAINLIEMIPNATLTPITWLLNGTILGHAARLQFSRELQRRWKREQEEEQADAGMRALL